MSFFEGLSPATLEKVSARCEKLDLGRGTVLIEEGALADSMFIVLRGRFVVLAGETPIAIIKSGEPIGELGFFAGNPRTATVVAARNSSVLRISKEAFEDLARTTPELSQAILASVSGRLARATGANLKIRPRAGRNICLAPAGEGAINPGFIAALRKAFDGFPEWEIVESSDCPADIAKTKTALSAWLDERENAATHVLFICAAPADDRVWFECVGEICDTDILVGEAAKAGQGAIATTVEEDVLIANSLPGSLQLALWRDRQTDRISATADWLAGRAVALHHHVALDSEQDFARLARFIRGEAIGLVLCGGGALGMAHLGALKALYEHGLEFDLVGGTSIGSALAAGVGLKMDPEAILRLCEEVFLKSKAMHGLTLPVHSILDPKRLDNALMAHFGQVQIEDLPINYFAVATSLTTNDLFVMRSGLLWQAVRASGALPGVLPPMVTDAGDVLIDGGLVDNVPVQVARELKPGPNLVFNLVTPKEWRVNATYADLPGRAALLWRMITRRRGKKRFPKLFSVLTRTMIINSRRLIEHTDMGEDVLIHLPTLRRMGFLEWKKARAQFEAAYKEMSAVLDRVDSESGEGTALPPMERLRRAGLEITEKRSDEH